MKELLSILAILAIAMPSMAGITVDVAVTGDTAVITYTADAGDEPCALALDITPVNAGDVLSSYTMPVDSFFDVFIDQASDDVAATGSYTVGTGSPIAKVAEAGVASIDSGAVCISIAGFEDDKTDVAPTSATIITLTGSGTFNIGVNTIRGGVVKADSAAPAVDVTFTVDGVPGTVFPFPSVKYIWDDAFCSGHANGDANCDGYVNLADLFALKVAFGASTGAANYTCNADFTEDGVINLADLFALKAGFGTSGYLFDAEAVCE